MLMNVAIAEDERLSALFLEETLEKLGCHVLGIFDNGAALLEAVSAHAVDFVIMDIELEGEVNGVEAALALRHEHDIPVVFITSHTDSATIGQAMQAEPLGYVIKPISASHIESVVGVVKGLLGRESSAPQSKAPKRTALGLGFSYDFETRNLFRDDNPVDLTASELKLFDLCLRRKGTIVPYNVIDDEVWADKYVTESTRRGLFHRLRNKLDNQLFETVIGVGCRIRLPEKN